MPPKENDEFPRVSVYERIVWDCPKCQLHNESGPDTVASDLVECKFCKAKVIVGARYR